jgi:autotransporter-associated beta strand protein
MSEPRRPLCGIRLFFAVCPLSVLSLYAQTPRDFAIDLAAAPSTNTPCLTLNWSIRRQGNIKYQKIHRRLKGETAWTKLADLDYIQTSYADSNAVVGVEYEYWMERYYTNIYPNTAMGYLSAGVNVPMAESRGKLLLVVDNTMVTPLAPEIAQLQAELTGDGWLVQTLTAARADTAINTKALIKAAYDADPTNLKMVYILGHVPVPYSGSIAPDGHGNHSGAWPADGYYGDMDGTWTDTTVNNTSASDVRNHNIPGDGKFDQSSLPSPVELMVGRVDLHSMTRAPASAVSETSLLRRYLRKAHDFRFKQGAYADIPRRSIMRDGFSYFGGENFAIAGWSWMFTGVGTAVDEPPSMQWFLPAYAGGKSYLMGYGNGGGSWDTASTVGNSADFGLKTSRVVFTSLFGSYFGDWDVANNFMRAPLAGNATGDSLGLTCFWGGRPNRVNHQMGMGETAGYCMRVSHNSAQAGGGGYTPNIYAGVHCGLLGDPSLRLHAVEPPRNLSASSANTQVTLAWSASSEANLLGYLVYRADTAVGPFTRLTASPQAETAYTDAGVTADQSYTYLVRTLKLETSPGGTYENPSVGSLVTLTASAGAAAAPANPSSLVVTQNSATNAWLSWSDNSDNESGFRVERKTNAAGSFAAIGTVGANVTTFTDPGAFTHGNVYYYRIVAIGASGESPPSKETAFDAVAGFFDVLATRVKVSKTAGTAVISVNRIGGVTGPVSVNFATSDSSAFAGTHYTATNGTLAWADGETGAKTISVPLINTASPQAARQFKVALSAPSAGTALTVNTYAAVLIEDPTASLGAPWSQVIVGGITDSSPAVTEAGAISSVTIGGSGLTASATSDNGQFVYQSHAGDGVLTAFFPAGLPGDGNARYALMARASTANNAIMAATVTSSSTGFGTRFFSRSSAGGSSSLQPSSANTLVIARWVRLIRSGNTFSAETSADGVEWTAISTATLASMPVTAVWGVFHTSSDWSVTGLGNYHLAQAQSVTLTSIPAPPTPTGLAATAASSTSASLRWNSASFASGYRVERRGESGDFAAIAWLAAASGTNQTYSNTGLDVNTAYAYRIVATNAVGESAPSAVAYVATSADMLVRLTTDGTDGADAAVRLDVPEVPLGTQTNLTIAGYDSNTYELLPNAAKCYLRFRLGDIGACKSAQLKMVSLGQTNAFSSGYFYLYASLLEEGSDTWNENEITWSNAPQNNVFGYDFTGTKIHLGNLYDDAPPALGETMVLNLNTAALVGNRGANNLVTIGLYQYYDVSEWASREHPTFAPPTLELIVTTNVPPRASFLTASAGTGWSVDLQWQDTSTNETGFVLERREGGGEFAELQTFGANATAFHDGTTEPGVTYTYRVRAFNAFGPSDWTPEATITAATLETAVSTIWDGEGADTLFTTATNWDFNTQPAFNGSARLTFGSGGSAATVNAGAALHGLTINRDADFTLAAGGGTLTLGAGGLLATLPTATSRAYALEPDIVIASNQTWSVTNNGAGVATLTVSGSVSDGGAGVSLTKSGNGVLSLSGDNSYSGITAVRTGGVLRISHPNALGTADGATSVENGGWLEVSGGVTVAEPITLAGDAALGYAGTLRSTADSNVWSGPITFNGARVRATGGSLDVTGGCTGPGGVMGANGGTFLRVSGLPVLFGTGTFYGHGGGGTTILDVAGNTWGLLDIASSVIRTDVPGALPATSTLQLNANTTVDLNGNSQTVGQFKNGAVTSGSCLVTTLAPATLTVDQSVTTTYDGRLAGALGLTKAGSGSLTLSLGPNTLSGAVTVQGGTLTVGSASSLGNSTNVAVEGGTLLLQAVNSITNAAVLRVADGATVSIAAGITETVETLFLGGVRKGSGTWGASGSGAEYVDDAHFSGSGKIFVSSGFSTVWDAGGSNTGFSTPNNWDYDVRPVSDGSTYLTFGTAGSEALVNANLAVLGLRLNREADFTLAAGGGTLTLGAGGFWAQAPSATPRIYTLAAPVTLAADQTWGVTNTGAGHTTLAVSGPVSDSDGTFGIAKAGDGTLVLSGDSAYDGTTSVAAGGGLRVAHDRALGSTNGATTVASGAWLEVGGGVTVGEPLSLAADGTGGAGNLRATDGTNAWGGPVTQTGASRVRVLGGARLTLSGGVKGSTAVVLSPDAGGELAVTDEPVNVGSSGKVYANGAGTVALASAGNVFGTLEIAGLTVRTDAPGTLPPATILAVGTAYSANGTLDLNGNSQTVSQLKRGTTAAGVRVVTSSSPATLTVSGSASTTYDGWLSGELGLTKAGSSTLTLSGPNNTFSGATVVSGGTLDVSAASRLGNSASVQVTGGTLRLRSANAVLDTATLRIEDGTATVRVDGGSESVGALYLGGIRQGPGTYGSTASGADVKNNTYFYSSATGMVSVAFCEPGSVWDGGGATDTRFDQPNNWDTDWPPNLDGSAYIRFGVGGTLATLNTNAPVRGLLFSSGEDFTLAAGGGVLTLGTGGLCALATNDAPHLYTVAAPVTLAADQAWGVTNAGAGLATLVVSGPVADGASTFGIAKTGDGLLTLAGDSSYDGATAVASGGGLRAEHDRALGSTNGNTTVASGAWLEVGGGVSVSEPLALTADGTGGAGNLRATDGENAWSGPVTQTGAARVRVLDGARLTLSGGVKGSTAVYLAPDAGGELAVTGAPVNLGSSGKVYANGAGTVALASAGNVFGTLEIAGLTVRTDAPGTLPPATILAVGTAYSANGTLDLNGNSQTVSQLKRGTTAAGTRVVTSSSPATLTVSGSTGTTYYDALTGALGLTKAGSATLVLSGANNTFSGATVVSGGTLEVGAASRLGNSVSVRVTGGTLRLRNANAVPDTAAVRIDDGGAELRIDSGIETVGALYLGDRRQRRGTYGASTSAAEYTNDSYFNTRGTGVLNVLQGPGSVLSVR